MEKVINQLMTVVPYKFTGKEIGEMKKNFLRYELMEDYLPEFCIHNESGKIISSSYYLQYVETGNQEYILFDITHKDSILSEEISQVGIENFDDGYFYNYLSIFEFETYKNFRKVIPLEKHIVFELKYITSRNSDNEVDYDFEYKIKGYLNDKMELIKYGRFDRKKI